MNLASFTSKRKKKVVYQNRLQKVEEVDIFEYRKNNMVIRTELNYINKQLIRFYLFQRPSILDTCFFIYLITQQVIQFMQKMYFKLKT